MRFLQSQKVHALYKDHMHCKPCPHLITHRLLGRELKLADNGVDLLQAGVEVQKLTVAPEDIPLLISYAHIDLVHMVLV